MGFDHRALVYPYASKIPRAAFQKPYGKRIFPGSARNFTGGKVYYASWQKGGNENANGRLRRWLPRNTDPNELSDTDIQEIVLSANLTPRKCPGYKTPFQAILAECGKNVLISFA